MILRLLMTMTIVSIFCVNIANASSVITTTTNITPTMVKGSDDYYHLVYEIIFKSNSKENLRLKQVDIIDKHSRRLISSYHDKRLAAITFQIAADNKGTNETLLIPDTSLVFFPFISLKNKNDVPDDITHHFIFENDKKQRIEFDGDIISVNKKPVDVIVSPIKGGGWVGANAPGEDSSHRFAFLYAQGKYYIAQRFAIDWNRVNEFGSVFVKQNADPKKNESYYDYGAAIYSAAAGTVAYISNNYKDNIPGTIPPEVQNVENACGNAIGIDIGNGHYAFYCHLKPNSIKVKMGDKVEQGKEIAELGNSGNSIGPHLHFHISNNKYPLASEGLPYIIADFGQQLSAQKVREVGILDFQSSKSPLFQINNPGTAVKNAIPMKDGIYYFH